MSPQRIQLSRQKGWRKPENTVVVSRPSKWGNPFRIAYVDCSIGGMCWVVRDGHGIRREHIDNDAEARRVAVELYELHTGPMGDYELDVDRVRRELAGKDLACWCPLDDGEGNHVPCHADVLLRLANSDAEW